MKEEKRKKKKKIYVKKMRKKSKLKMKKRAWEKNEKNLKKHYVFLVHVTICETQKQYFHEEEIWK